MAIKALNSVGAEGKYAVLELDESQQFSTEQWKGALMNYTGKTSVPQVWIAGKHIGSGSETVEHARSGKLEILLKKCGVLEPEKGSSESF